MVITMVRGLPKSYIKKYGVSKKAWREYRKAHPKRGRRTRKTRRASNPVKKRRKRMARRKKRRRRSGMTIPIAPIAGLAAGLIEPIQYVVDHGNWRGAVEVLCRNYTGYRPGTQTWEPHYMTRGLVPLVIGLLVHKFVGGSPLNANRMLARAGVPFIRI